MEDKDIIKLYWQRDERAITESSAKYGGLCMALAKNLLADSFEAEECVNDTWLKAWAAMPPKRPDVLSAFLCRITRNLSISRLRARQAEKRGGGEIALALEELRDCLPSRSTTEEEVEARELARLLNAFLAELGQEERDVFLSRYWFGASIALICERTGSKPSRIKSMLSRSRKRLLKYLQEVAYYG